MSKEGTRYMWILVFFDLPVKTKRQREIATKFRRFLIQDGYIMIQFSVYARVCNGRERLEKHLKKIQDNLPKKGNVRILEVTDQQYGRMRIIVGNPKENEKKRTDQLLLF